MPTWGASGAATQMQAAGAQPLHTALRRYEEYVPLKKRRQQEEQQRLARLGRAAPQPASSADTGGSSRSGGSKGYGSEPEVDHRQRESLLIMKAKALQEVGRVVEEGVRGGVAC